MNLLLIRHGETDWNTAKRIQGGTDIPLNENGLRQAHELAETLAAYGTPICAIYTSPLSRALQTAQIAAARLNMTYQTDDALREMHFGLWEGISWDEVKLRFPHEYQRWRDNRRYECPPHGESYQTMLSRFVPALQKIISCTRTDGDIITVSHSACIVSFLALLNDTPFHEMAKRYSLTNTGIISIEADRILTLKTLENN